MQCATTLPQPFVGTFYKSEVHKLVHPKGVEKREKLPEMVLPNTMVYTVTCMRDHSNCLCSSSKPTVGEATTTETESVGNSSVPSSANKLQDRSNKARCVPCS